MNRSRQRYYTAEEDATSPTVSTEALLLTAAIDTSDGQLVATCDITGIFLEADMDEFVLISLHREEIDALVKANENYEKFVHINKNGKKVLCLELIKAMYGCLKSARLFWELLSTHLGRMGFTSNQYDLCVANKQIDGSMCTIAWHVDDLKISHRSETVVRDIIHLLEQEYRKMTVMTGEVLTYCGMTLIFKNKSVVVDMKEYLREAMEELDMEYGRKVTTPAANHLFDVNKHQFKLDEDRKKLFHRITAKLLLVSKRGRPDIQVALSFLTTRVTQPDEDD